MTLDEMFDDVAFMTLIQRKARECLHRDTRLIANPRGPFPYDCELCGVYHLQAYAMVDHIVYRHQLIILE